MLATRNAAFTSDPRPLVGRRALIAENVLRTRNLLRDAVHGLGTREIVCCEHGAEAVAALRARRFDLVVCGQVHGDGYDSALFLERVREERLVPLSGTLVAIAAERTSRSVTGLAVHSPDACILKPFTSGELRDRLQRIVAHKQRLQPVMAAIDAGDWHTAIEVCQLLDPDPGDLPAIGFRAICEYLIEHKLGEQAEQVLAQARRLGDSPWMALALARIRSLQGDHAQAREMLERLVGESPEFIAPYDTLAGMEAGRGKFDDALKHLQEATTRAGFSLGRLRRTGEVAARGGHLQVAEEVLDRVFERVKDSELNRSSDYVNLVEVLSARGKLNRAEHIAKRLRGRFAHSPDSELIGPLIAYRRAYSESTPAAAHSAFESLLDTYERHGSQASLEVRIQVLEACVEQGAREDGYALARSIAASGQADRLTLQRIRRLVDR